MKKAMIAGLLASSIASGAFAGGKNDVMVESEPTDPYIPVAASSSSAGGMSSALIVGGIVLALVAAAASTGSN